MHKRGITPHDDDENEGEAPLFISFQVTSQTFQGRFAFYLLLFHFTLALGLRLSSLQGVGSLGPISTRHWLILSFVRLLQGAYGPHVPTISSPHHIRSLCIMISIVDSSTPFVHVACPHYGFYIHL